MKKTKKLLSLLFASTLILTACSTGTNTGQSTPAQTTTQELSKEDILKKVFEANKLYNSVDLNSETIISPSIQKEPQSITIKLIASSISNPLSMKINMDMLADQNSLLKTDVILKDDVLYVQGPDKSWIKTTNKQMIDEIKKTSNLSASDAYINIFTSSPEKINITQKDGKYEIIYSGDGAELQKIAEDLTKSLNFPEEQRNLKYKKAHVKYTIDKSTFYAEKVDADLVLTSENLGFDLSVKSNMTLSNHNKITEISLPEEAKSAIEIPNQ